MSGKYAPNLPEIIIPSGRSDSAYRFALNLAGYKLAHPEAKITIVRAHRSASRAAKTKKRKA